MSNTEALRAACTAMLDALDGMADRDNAGGLMPWVGYFGPYGGTDYGAALDAAMADARAELAQPAASGEPVAPKCPTPKGCEHNGLCRGRCTTPQPLVAPESWRSLAETANRTLERAERREARNAASEPVAPDWLLRSTVADLLHLLQFSSISTSTGADDVQARKTMASLRRMLAEGPQPAPALVPLTDAQVEALRARVTGAPYLTAVQLIRETEAAHGITPAKEAP